MIRRLTALVLLAAAGTATWGEDPPNPHWAVEGCRHCHAGEPRTMSLAEGEATCDRCHDAASVAQVIHPLDLPPGRLAGRMAEMGVPLLDGRIGCLSCHDLTVQCLGGLDARSANAAFLRGPDGGSASASCFLCHSADSYQRQNPHRQWSGDGALLRGQCSLCHVGEVEPGARHAEVHVAEPALCTGCHQTRNHPGGVNHMVTPSNAFRERMSQAQHGDALAGMTPRQVQAYLAAQPPEPTQSLPAGYGGRIVCTTCHNPHDEGIFGAADPRGQGADEPRRLRMGEESLCAACHPD